MFRCCMGPISVDFQAKVRARFHNRSKTGTGSTSSGCAREGQTKIWIVMW